MSLLLRVALLCRKFLKVAIIVMANFNCVGYQVLGIPWDIDTEGLRQYMLRFGELDDVIVMKVS